MYAWANVTDMQKYIDEKRWNVAWKEWSSTRQWEYPWIEEMLAKLKVETVADCGCGSSPFAIHLADMGYKVYAIDNFSSTVTETTKAFCEKNKNKVTFVDSNLTNISLASDSVDCVICVSVMEHIADKNLSQRVALKEMCRIVRPGGHLIVTNDTFLNPQITEWWNPPTDALWATENCGVELLDPLMKGFKKEDLQFVDDLFVVPPDLFIKWGYGKALPDGSGGFNIGLYHRLTSLAYVLKKK